MRIALFDADPELRDALAVLLRGRGHTVSPSLAGEAPDVVVVGLPAPSDLSPDALPDAPLLLLIGSALALGELERWQAASPRWSILWKPVRESALDLSIARIARASAPIEETRALRLSTLPGV